MSDAISLHFRETLEIDGVPYLQQMTISSGRIFTYTFRVYSADTFFHYSQAQILFGSLIIHHPDHFRFMDITI